MVKLEDLLVRRKVIEGSREVSQITSLKRECDRGVT